MKVELLVSEWCQSCHQAERVWREVAQEKDFEFSVLDMGQPEGRELVSRLRLKTVPSLVVDGIFTAIGPQTLAQAREIVSAAPDKEKSSVQHAGLSMSLDNRWFVMAAMVYLALAGLGLLINGALLSDGPTRPVALHLFTTGFILFLVFGLGAHMLPRFTGKPIRRGAWPWWQMGLAHVGVLSFTLVFLLGLPAAVYLPGGLALWLAMLIFTLRLWPVLWPVAKHETV